MKKLECSGMERVIGGGSGYCTIIGFLYPSKIVFSYLLVHSGAALRESANDTLGECLAF